MQLLGIIEQDKQLFVHGSHKLVVEFFILPSGQLETQALL